ncbi:MAG: hypothetical protein WBQ66_17865, partial [Blastocatellia bacterium]
EDDCPLCCAARSQGGHVVFAGSDDNEPEDAESDDELVVESPTFVQTPIKAPAVELLRALDRLDVAADELVCALEPIASAELLKRTIEDVGFMHDRFVESMWAEESPARLEAFEKELARATETLAVVRAAHEPLASHVTLVTAALDTIAGIWRGL